MGALPYDAKCCHQQLLFFRDKFGGSHHAVALLQISRKKQQFTLVRPLARQLIRNNTVPQIPLLWMVMMMMMMFMMHLHTECNRVSENVNKIAFLI